MDDCPPSDCTFITSEWILGCSKQSKSSKCHGLRVYSGAKFHADSKNVKKIDVAQFFRVAILILSFT